MSRNPHRGGWAALFAGALLVSCASQPTGRFFLDRARESQQAGDLERALFYTESALQQRPFELDPDEIALHLDVLRGLDRAVEADAFADFATRYTAGEDTDTTRTVPTPGECQKLQRQRSKTTRLIREFGEMPVRGEFDIGALAATYEIDAEGQPIHIRVIRAKHPAAAWLIIHSLAGAKVWKTRLAETSEPFPIAHCAYWTRAIDPTIDRKAFIPPRMVR
jgi:hypothetical protein